MNTADHMHMGLVPTMVRTLIGNRFVLDTVERKPHYMLFKCHRYDEFGVSMPYVFVLCEDSPLGAASAQAIARDAAARRSHAIAICDEPCVLLPSLSWTSFLARCGGPIRSWLPLEATFAPHIDALGHNQAVDGLVGRPDDLFEEYVHVGLQFLLADRVIRYGQDRRGEALPDGLAFSKDHLALPYDAKAYSNGYEVNHNSIRQFASYVRDFDTRYGHYLGRPYAFLLVSGHFTNGVRSLSVQSRALQVECGVSLVYMKAADLGAATTVLAQQPALRSAINWRKVFTETLVTLSVINEALDTVRKDNIMRV